MEGRVDGKNGGTAEPKAPYLFFGGEILYHRRQISVSNIFSCDEWIVCESNDVSIRLMPEHFKRFRY